MSYWICTAVFTELSITISWSHSSQLKPYHYMYRLKIVWYAACDDYLHELLYVCLFALVLHVQYYEVFLHFFALALLSCSNARLNKQLFSVGHHWWPLLTVKSDHFSQASLSYLPLSELFFLSQGSLVSLRHKEQYQASYGNSR